MLKDYYIVEKSALPDFFLKVIEAKRLMENGQCQQVSDAVKRAGISRSTYYKYRDSIIEPVDITSGRKAVISLMVLHEAGALSKVISRISVSGASVLTMNQSLPINARASVTFSLDISGMTDSIDTLVKAIADLREADNVKLIAVE